MVLLQADILRHLVTYSTSRTSADNLVTITARRAFDIIALNREGKQPESLSEDGAIATIGSGDLLAQDSLTRFDRKKKKKKKPNPSSKERERRAERADSSLPQEEKERTTPSERTGETTSTPSADSKNEDNS